MSKPLPVTIPPAVKPDLPEDPNTLILYIFEVCPFVQRVLITAAFKGIKNIVMVPLPMSEKPQWFLDIQPAGKCPFAQYKGKSFVESLVLAEFLDEEFPGPKLYPEDPVDRAVTKMWIQLVGDLYIPAMYGLLMSDAASKKEKYNKFLEAWRNLNQFLVEYAPNGPFFLGERFSAADAAVAPFFQRTQMVEHYDHFKVPDTPEYARMVAYREALMKEPIVIETCHTREVLIKMYYDYHLGIRSGRATQDANGLGCSSFDVEKAPLDSRPLPPRLEPYMD